MASDTTVKLRADISELKAAMQQAARAVRVANSEFKASTAGMDKWSSSAEGLQAKLKQLNAVLKAQKTQLSLAEAELQKTEAAYGENAAETDRARIKFNNMKAAVNKTEADLQKYEAQLEDVTSETKQMDNALEDSGNAARRVSDGFTVMKGALANLLADGIRATIRGLQELAKETFNAGASFEQAMAQVEAISGANGSEMDQLTAKAKEMGETTKFSATESAEAFNYMAMAGWETEDMLSGIEGIMSLAAASGSDLATTSDIVTDALTAMGYSAGDAGKLADVMAAASANANTNVELMGSTFQYAAPLAGALGYNMEDVAVAIGLMANAGVKGQKAGTALRSIFTRLADPPEAAAKAMEKYGISLTDSQGKMKPFNEVMQDMRDKFKDLSETEQAQVASAIAGKNAISGFLAIVNGSDADFDKLTKAVKNSEGAAKDMADTMNDTVQGQLTLLRSQIEGKMIQVFEKAAPKIRAGIDQISKALENVNWDAVGDKVAAGLSKVLDFIRMLIDNRDTVVSVAKSIGTALASMFVVNKSVSAVRGIKDVITVLTDFKSKANEASVAGGLLGKAATAAPYVALAAAVAGAAYAFGQYGKKKYEAIEANNELTQAEKEQVQAIHSEYEAYKQLDSERNNSMQGITAEYDNLSALVSEYNSHVGANGKVKKSYQDRANFIITQLANAFGVERSEIEKQINANGKLSGSIKDVIEQKRAEAMLSANEGAYQTAIQNQSKALTDYVQSSQKAEEAKRQYAAASAEVDSIQTKLDNSTSMANRRRLGEDLKAAQAAAAGRKQAMQETSAAAKEAETTYVGYQATIRNYEGLAAAIESGNANKIAAALQRQRTNFITAKDGTKATLQQQVKDAQANYNALKAAVDSGAKGVTQAQVDEAKKMVDASKAELEKLSPAAKKAGSKAGSEYAKGVSSKKGSAKKAGQNVANAATNAEKAASKNAKKTGQTAGQNYAKGVESAKAKSKKAGQNVAKAGDDSVKKASKTVAKTGQKTGDEYAKGLQSKKGAATTAGKTVANGAKTGSGSVKGTGTGQEFGQGYVNGIRQYINSAYLAGAAIAQKANEGARSKKGQDSRSPSKLTFKTGKEFTQGYINGISSLQGSLVKTVQSVVSGVVGELGKMSQFNFSEVASNASTKFSQTFSETLEYNVARIQYNNEKLIKDFDDTIANLEKKQTNAASAIQKKSDKEVDKLEAKRDKKVKALEKKRDAAKNTADKKAITAEIKAVKAKYKKLIAAEKKETKKQINSSNASYKKLINVQNANKEAYQTASSQMISEYQKALNEYQTAAQKLIDDTINGISDKYTARYDELVSKQDNLIEKMKSAADLFDVSSAGVMTVNDIQAQTKQIRDYANRLEQIKEKVSSELFDTITSYDMKEGSAFVDRLLALSAEDLEAYNQAYTEKMEAASDAAKNIYKADFSKVASDYETEINTAFKGIDKQLATLGQQAMQGFINGLTKNTDYMDSSIKTFIQAMISEFKSALKIKSPSKVMFEIGEYTGEGFKEGLVSLISDIKDTASQLASAVSTPLNGFNGNLSGIVPNGALTGATGANSVVNNYNLVQNNTSPKSLSALETYQARRRQIAMMKAATMYSVKGA